LADTAALFTHLTSPSVAIISSISQQFLSPISFTFWGLAAASQDGKTSLHLDNDNREGF
jgi:hypothetical protein